MNVPNRDFWLSDFDIVTKTIVLLTVNSIFCIDIQKAEFNSPII